MRRMRELTVSEQRTSEITNSCPLKVLTTIEKGGQLSVLGCSMTFWLMPFIRDGLKERGWDVPVLEGYTASIELAKLMVNLGVNASGITYQGARSERYLSKIHV